MFSTSARKSTRTSHPPQRFEPIITSRQNKKKRVLPNVPHKDVCDECVICMDKINNTNVVVTECKHTFCASCLFMALKESSDCPLCRFKLTSKPVKLPELTPAVAISLVIDTINESEGPSYRDPALVDGTISNLTKKIFDFVKERISNGRGIHSSDGWASDKRFVDEIKNMIRNHMCKFGEGICRNVSQWIEHSSELEIDFIEDVENNPVDGAINHRALVGLINDDVENNPVDGAINHRVLERPIRLINDDVESVVSDADMPELTIVGPYVFDNQHAVIGRISVWSEHSEHVNENTDIPELTIIGSYVYVASGNNGPQPETFYENDALIGRIRDDFSGMSEHVNENRELTFSFVQPHTGSLQPIPNTLLGGFFPLYTNPLIIDPVGVPLDILDYSQVRIEAVRERCLNILNLLMGFNPQLIDCNDMIVCMRPSPPNDYQRLMVGWTSMIISRQQTHTSNDMVEVRIVNDTTNGIEQPNRIELFGAWVIDRRIGDNHDNGYRFYPEGGMLSGRDILKIYDTVEALLINIQDVITNNLRRDILNAGYLVSEYPDSPTLRSQIMDTFGIVELNRIYDEVTNLGTEPPPPPPVPQSAGGLDTRRFIPIPQWDDGETGEIVSAAQPNININDLPIENNVPPLPRDATENPQLDESDLDVINYVLNIDIRENEHSPYVFNNGRENLIAIDRIIADSQSVINSRTARL